MKLRLGQPVRATDGEYGEVGDIVIDPHERVVTHLIVQPHRQHQLARLVPMWLVEVEDDVVSVALDTAHIRALQHVAFSDFVRFGERIPVGDDWDIGTEDVVAMPYYNGMFDMGPSYLDQIDVTYDRIPKGECEIRRKSQIQTSDDHVVGHVEGFIADEGHLVAVIARTGIAGLRHNVVIPMSKVEKVRTDLIELSIDKATFGDLPKAEGIEGPLGETLVDDLEHRAAAAVGKVRDGAGRLLDRAKHLVDRGGEDEE